MRGARSRCEAPAPAESQPPENEAQLDRLLQHQLEEDVAKIFDESIYSDVDVVCGKLKILTHSCILKTRANNFYHRLESILKNNISRNSYDEVYSFISDTYTECDIRDQEKEILKYLDDKLDEINKSNHLKPTEDQELFFTPKCLTPNPQEFNQYPVTSTPSAEPTKDTLLEKELNEQDALSNAFQSILNLSGENNSTDSYTKPTTLSLASSLRPKSVEHSSRCDIILDNNVRKDTDVLINHEFGNLATPKGNSGQTRDSYGESIEKSQDQGYSPDSLITDEPSSSSDYLSAAYPLSPGASLSGVTQLNVSCSSSIKMEDKTSLDSGFERSDPNDVSRSLCSNRDVTLTDVSLTESTLQDLTMDDTHVSMSGANNIPPVSHTASNISGANNSAPSSSQKIPTNPGSASSSEDSNVQTNPPFRGTRPTVSKAEKQKQNQEIHVMESSSLSSEAGSWESVFPPWQSEGVICVKIINGEVQQANQGAVSKDQNKSDKPCEFPYGIPVVKATPCFIDASSLMDDTEDNTIKIWSRDKSQVVDKIIEPQSKQLLPKESQIPSSHPPIQQQCNTVETASRGVLPQTAEQSYQPEYESTAKALYAQTPPSRPITFSSLESWPRSERSQFSVLVSIPRTPSPAQVVPTQTVDPLSQPVPSSTQQSVPQAMRTRTNPSQPSVPGCDAQFKSGSDESEGNKTDDSLENSDDSESYEKYSSGKNLYPTVFDMTPTSEESFNMTSITENAKNSAQNMINMRIEERKGAEKDTKQSSINEERSLQFPQEFVLANTPHNSILTIKSTSVKPYDSEGESDSTVISQETGNHTKAKKYNESSPIVSGGASIEDHLPQIGSASSSPMIRRKIENIPIVSGAYIPPVETNNPPKAQKPSCVPAWVVDMSTNQQGSEQCSSHSTGYVKKPIDKHFENIKSESRHHSFDNGDKSRSSVDSDSSEKSSHKFYVDFANLPSPPLSNDKNEAKEKKNIFSMYIGLEEESAAKKEMPVRLSSSLTTRKNAGVDAKSKNFKQEKEVRNANGKNTLPKKGTTVFEKIESMCSDPNISLSELINIHETFRDEIDNMSPAEREAQSRQALKNGCGTFLSLTPSDPLPFVRLSDLDRPVPRSDPQPEQELNSSVVRMTRSIPENNWRAPSASGSRSKIDVISSFHSENATSLNRLFPHLKNELSRSMPGSLSSRNQSPMRPAEGYDPAYLEELSLGERSDTSEASSAQSSMGPSGVGISTEENSQASSLIGNCQSRLGQDLLRMFLEEIAPDVVVEVGGRRIKAHKCILSSRCQYFAGILSGGWVESAGNVIALPPRFSYGVVQFAMCHIYSGVSSIPDTISIMELAALSDMLGLEGLKEAIMFTLKVKYCHHFHKPCHVCIVGVLECFPLTAVYGLDDLYHKCLKWITKYFSQVWPTKAFATLPRELHDKCLQQLANTITVENFLDHILGSGLLVMKIASSGRWSDTVIRLCRRFVTAAASFAGYRLVEVLRAAETIPSDLPEPALDAYSECMSAAFEWAPPDAACSAYAYLQSVVARLRMQRSDHIRSPNRPPRDLLETFAPAFQMRLEGALVRSAPRVVGTAAFNNLPPDLRRRLRELGCIMYGAQTLPQSPAHNRRTRNAAPPNNNRGTKPASANNIELEQVRASFVPYAIKPPVTATYDMIKINNDLHSKLNVTRQKVRTTKAQEERARYNLSKNNLSQERLNASKMWRPYEDTKPRYLEPKAPKAKETNMGVHQRYSVKKRLGLIPPSSSDSSRNSSPVQARQRVRATPQPAQPPAPPRSAEPSTDSRSDSQASNKYATYTKAKHPPQQKNKGESTSQANPQPSQGAIKKVPVTKIPVYRNQSKTSAAAKQPKEKTRPNPTATNGEEVNGTRPRRPNSLMSATKSSSAKVVPKVAKEDKSRQPKRGPPKREDPPQVIPVMERSGTFLKDEPTFGIQSTRFGVESETE